METLYYASRTPLQPGDVIRPFEVRGHQSELENIFERVRREEFPDRPPREGSVFLCPEPDGFCSGRMSRPHVYEVEVRRPRKLFQTNAELFTKAGGDHSPEYIEDIARDYWEGQRAPFFPEVLVQGGKVVVRGPVRESIVHRIDTLLESTSQWTPEGFFRRWPKLKKYAPPLNRIIIEPEPDRRRPDGTHLATQRGNKIHIWPRFFEELDKYGDGPKDFALAHEIGHYHSDAGYGPWGRTNSIVDAAKEFDIDIIAEWGDMPYGQPNYDEAFAETFAAYFMNPSELQRRYPRWYRFIESTL